MSSLTLFRFESKSIRVLSVAGEPWFVARDAAEALDYASATIANADKMLAHVPDEWKGRFPIPTPGGKQEVWCLSEAGLYFFVNRSDKPKALPFQKWVAGDVLPAIRQAGSYPAARRPARNRDADQGRLHRSLEGAHRLFAGDATPQARPPQPERR